MRLRRTSHLLVALLTLALLLPATTAWASPNAPVPGGVNPAPPTEVERTIAEGVKVAGQDVGGMTEGEARSAIVAAVSADGLPALTVKASDLTFSLPGAEYLYPDVSEMLAAALSASPGANVAATYEVDTPKIAPFVSTVARKVDRSPVNAKWTLSGNRLKLIAAVTGRRTDVIAGRSAVRSALLREAAAGKAQAAVTIPVRITTPSVTEKNITKAILVVLSERTLRLYDKGSVAKKYNCAVGTSAHPTPRGLFEIVLKRYMPTWVNPAPGGWGSGMPAYIGPGPNNPLGTRALNLNADGIRIHGTNNVDSIGTAASHGCIRLVRHDVEELYDLVKVGTPVYIIK